MKTVKNNISNGFFFWWTLLCFDLLAGSWPCLVAGGQILANQLYWLGRFLAHVFSSPATGFLLGFTVYFRWGFFQSFLSEQPQYFFHLHQIILDTHFLLQLVCVPYMQDKERHENLCTPPLIGLKPSGCKLGPLYGEFGLLTDPCWGPTRGWTPWNSPIVFFLTKKVFSQRLGLLERPQMRCHLGVPTCNH